jgi:signal transduction histidine kinase
LPLYFALVAAFGALAAFLLVRRAAEGSFRSFVFSGDAAKAAVYAGLLADFYAQRGGWDGAQAFLDDIPELVYLTLDQRLRPEAADSPLAASTPEAVRGLLADRVVLADASGVIVADTAAVLAGSVHPADHLALGVPVAAGGVRRGTVLVGSMVDSSLTGVQTAFLAAAAASLVGATALAALGALALGLALSVRLLRPIAALAAGVRGVSAGGARPPLAVEGDDELADLAVAFNAMVRDLDRLAAARRRLLADSAHELRTPVTLIRGNLEAMLDGVYPRDDAAIRAVLDETLRLAGLIDALRELEGLESGELAVRPVRLDLYAAVRRAADRFAAAAAERGLGLECAPEPDAPPLPVAADPLRLDQVLDNLVGNALRYTPPGGLVRLSAGAAPAGWAELAVDDSGPGIPEAERERVFERFYRLEASRAADSGGRGLGLAIAAEIVKTHGGTIAAGASALGGARFEVRLPRLPPG